MIEVQFGKGDFALTDPGPYHVVKHASRDRSKRSSRDRDQSHGWEVWSLGDPSFDDEPVYVATYKDKGEARTKIARLRRSHPHVRYEIRRRRAAANRFFGSRGRRRGYRKVPRY